MTAPAPVLRVVEQLSAWFTTRFERLESLTAELVASLQLDAEGRLQMTDSTRRRLKSVAVRFLAEDELVDGCGLIFAHSALGTESGQLEWWVREDESRFARYSFGMVPGADRYYDYEHHEWFIRSFHGGTPSLAGPYIDYLGVEAYVLTFTFPAEVRGTRIGVVGADVQVADLETALLPLLLRSPIETALLGLHGNVIFGNSSRFLPGDYVPEGIAGFRRIGLDPAEAGVTLLYADG
ncbi:MAG: cache domain-containing protein [Leucobacter sp.]